MNNSKSTEELRAYMPPSNTVEWSTPQDLFDELNKEFGFTIDVAATTENTKLPRYYDINTDGLKQDWSGETVWCNPPYGRQIKDWVKKAAESKAVCVLLIPSRTDTKWFHEHIYGKAEVRFIKGRLKSGGHKDSAPFPNMIVIFGRKDLFTQELEKAKAEADRRVEEAKAIGYKKGRDSVGGESVGEAWERGRRAGIRAFELSADSEYFKRREGIIGLLCLFLWMKSWDEVKDNPRRFEQIMGFMRHFDQYVDKRIEDSYEPAALNNQSKEEA